AVRIVDNADAAREDLLPHLVLEEAGAARDRRAVDGADEMADQAVGDARIVDDRDLRGRGLARIEAAHRALAGGFAERHRVGQALAEYRAGEIVVALHAGAFAGQNRDADAPAAGGIAAAEAVAGGERDLHLAPARFRALGVGDARHRPRRILRARD